MNVRKEPIVFLLVAAALGYKGMELYKDSGTAGRPPKPRALDYESVGLDDLSLVRPEAGRGIDFERNLFAPPSATSPLPPLSPELPPFAALPALAPPTANGNERRLFEVLTLVFVGVGGCYTRLEVQGGVQRSLTHGLSPLLAQVPGCRIQL